jgi:hypothetical protein
MREKLIVPDVRRSFVWLDMNPCEPLVDVFFLPHTLPAWEQGDGGGSGRASGYRLEEGPTDPASASVGCG